MSPSTTNQSFLRTPTTRVSSQEGRNGFCASNCITPRRQQTLVKFKETGLNIYLCVRPLSQTERSSCVDVDRNPIILHPPSSQLRDRGQAKLFAFNRVFCPTTDQMTVFGE
jgi:hypothetical protein